jgi:4-hydroxybenzoate polyprenyltransferase
MDGVIHKIKLYLGMIKIAHSVFALPFAFTAALLAASGLPSARQLFWITVAMVGARSGAMGLNRIVDAKIDALNPRTCNREIPAGRISAAAAMAFTIISFFIMTYAAYELNTLCFALSPVAIVILAAYSYTKRFTWASHIVLGLALSGAPLGAWMAVRGTIDPGILPLVAAVVFWLAGFDTLYALQDIEFDRKQGLHSIPARFGVKAALMLSRIFHALTFTLLAVTGVIFGLNLFYWFGLLIILALLSYEHSLVKPDDLSRLDIAFFNMNGYISMTMFVSTFLAVLSK